jgi:putative heme iron utilization protein
MESEIYFVNMDGNIYFKVVDGVVYSRDRKTDVSPDKLSDFLAIAKELGFITGKL